MAVEAYVLKTYRYLRLAMVALVLLLLVSVVIEVLQAGGCVRTSISSYFFTPARGVFIGALVAIGACLIVIKGNTEVEDVLLNVAGLLSAVVAFVPIADPGECASIAGEAADTRAGVFNNVTALAVTGLLIVGVSLWLARREAGGRAGATLAVRHVVGIGASLALGGILLAGFLWARDLFDRVAHYVAAVPMFVILIAVMLINARSKARVDADRADRACARRDDVNRYSGIAAVTVMLTLVLLTAKWLGDWAHGLFWTEVVVILAFGVFWVTQTIELWNEPTGLRPDPEGVVSGAGFQAGAPTT